MVNRRSRRLNPTGDADIPAPPPASSSSSSSSSDAQAHKVPPVPEPDFAVQGGSEGGLDAGKEIGREDGVGSGEGDQGKGKEERVAAGHETGKRRGGKRARSPGAATGSPETCAVVYADEGEENKNGKTALALQFPPVSLSPEDSLQSFLSCLIRHITWRLLPSRSLNQMPIIEALRTALLSVSAKEGALSLPLSLPRDRAHGCSEGGHESVPLFQYSHKQRERRRPVWEAQQVAARNSVDSVMGGEGLGSCEGDPERVVFLSRKAWRLAAPLYDSGWGAGTFVLQRLFGTTSEEACGDCGFVWSRKDRERMITCEGGCRRPFHRSCVGLPPPASASSTYLKELRGDETVQKARAMRRRRRAKLRARLQRQEQKMAEAAAAGEEFDPDCLDGLDDSDEEEEGEETAVLSERLSKRQTMEEEKEEEEEGDEGNEDEQGEKEEGWACRWCRRGLVRCSHCRQYSPREETVACGHPRCARFFHPSCLSQLRFLRREDCDGRLFTSCSEREKKEKCTEKREDTAGPRDWDFLCAAHFCWECGPSSDGSGEAEEKGDRERGKKHRKVSAVSREGVPMTVDSVGGDGRSLTAISAGCCGESAEGAEGVGFEEGATRQKGGRRFPRTMCSPEKGSVWCVLCWRTFHPLCVPLGSAFVIPGEAVVCAHHLVMRDLRRSVEQMKTTEELGGGAEGVPASAKEDVKSLEDQAKQKAQEEGYEMKNKDSTAPSASEGEGARKNNGDKTKRKTEKEMTADSKHSSSSSPIGPLELEAELDVAARLCEEAFGARDLDSKLARGKTGLRQGWVLPPACRRAWLKSAGGKRDVALAEVLRSRVLLEDSSFDVCVEWAEAAERERRDGEKLLARKRVKAEREILAIETAERDEVEERRRRKEAQREKEERARLRAEQGEEEDGSDEEEEKGEEGRGRKPGRILGRDELRKEFQFITRNLWKAKREKKSADDLADDLCQCEGKCEMDKCANALIFMECGMRNCSKPNECENRRFSKQEYKEVHVRECGDKGKGLFAAEAIQENDFILEYIGAVWSKEDWLTEMEKIKARGEFVKHWYMMCMTERFVVDAAKQGNVCRYANHSCSPNCRMDLWTVGRDYRVGLFANRPIAPEEELTFDYNYESFEGLLRPCRCGAPNCSKWLGKKPIAVSSPSPVSKKKLKKKERGRPKGGPGSRSAESAAQMGIGIGMEGAAGVSVSLSAHTQTAVSASSPSSSSASPGFHRGRDTEASREWAGGEQDANEENEQILERERRAEERRERERLQEEERMRLQASAEGERRQRDEERRRQREERASRRQAASALAAAAWSSSPVPSDQEEEEEEGEREVDEAIETADKSVHLQPPQAVNAAGEERGGGSSPGESESEVRQPAALRRDSPQEERETAGNEEKEENAETRNAHAVPQRKEENEDSTQTAEGQPTGKEKREEEDEKQAQTETKVPLRHFIDKAENEERKRTEEGLLQEKESQKEAVSPEFREEKEIEGEGRDEDLHNSEHTATTTIAVLSLRMHEEEGEDNDEPMHSDAERSREKESPLPIPSDSPSLPPEEPSVEDSDPKRANPKPTEEADSPVPMQTDEEQASKEISERDGDGTQRINALMPDQQSPKGKQKQVDGSQLEGRDEKEEVSSVSCVKHGQTHEKTETVFAEKLTDPLNSLTASSPLSPSAEPNENSSPPPPPHSFSSPSFTKKRLKTESGDEEEAEDAQPPCPDSGAPLRLLFQKNGKRKREEEEEENEEEEDGGQKGESPGEGKNEETEDDCSSTDSSSAGLSDGEVSAGEDEDQMEREGERKGGAIVVGSCPEKREKGNQVEDTEDEDEGGDSDTARPSFVKFGGLSSLLACARRWRRDSARACETARGRKGWVCRDRQREAGRTRRAMIGKVLTGHRDFLRFISHTDAQAAWIGMPWLCALAAASPPEWLAASEEKLADPLFGIAARHSWADSVRLLLRSAAVECGFPCEGGIAKVESFLEEVASFDEVCTICLKRSISVSATERRTNERSDRHSDVRLSRCKCCFSAFHPSCCAKEARKLLLGPLLEETEEKGEGQEGYGETIRALEGKREGEGGLWNGGLCAALCASCVGGVVGLPTETKGVGLLVDATSFETLAASRCIPMAVDTAKVSKDANLPASLPPLWAQAEEVEMERLTAPVACAPPPTAALISAAADVKEEGGSLDPSGRETATSPSPNVVMQDAPHFVGPSSSSPSSFGTFCLVPVCRMKWPGEGEDRKTDRFRMEMEDAVELLRSLDEPEKVESTLKCAHKGNQIEVRSSNSRDSKKKQEGSVVGGTADRLRLDWPASWVFDLPGEVGESDEEAECEREVEEDEWEDCLEEGTEEGEEEQEGEREVIVKDQGKGGDWADREEEDIEGDQERDGGKEAALPCVAIRCPSVHTETLIQVEAEKPPTIVHSVLAEKDGQTVEPHSLQENEPLQLHRDDERGAGVGVRATAEASSSTLEEESERAPILFPLSFPLASHHHHLCEGSGGGMDEEGAPPLFPFASADPASGLLHMPDGECRDTASDGWGWAGKQGEEGESHEREFGRAGAEEFDGDLGGRDHGLCLNIGDGVDAPVSSSFPFDSADVLDSEGGIGAAGTNGCVVFQIETEGGKEQTRTERGVMPECGLGGRAMGDRMFTEIGTSVHLEETERHVGESQSVVALQEELKPRRNATDPVTPHRFTHTGREEEKHIPGGHIPPFPKLPSEKFDAQLEEEEAEEEGEEEKEEDEAKTGPTEQAQREPHAAPLPVQASNNPTSPTAPTQEVQLEAVDLSVWDPNDLSRLPTELNSRAPAEEEAGETEEDHSSSSSLPRSFSLSVSPPPPLPWQKDIREVSIQILPHAEARFNRRKGRNRKTRAGGVEEEPEGLFDGLGDLKGVDSGDSDFDGALVPPSFDRGMFDLLCLSHPEWKSLKQRLTDRRAEVELELEREKDSRETGREHQRMQAGMGGLHFSDPRNPSAFFTRPNAHGSHPTFFPSARPTAGSSGLRSRSGRERERQGEREPLAVLSSRGRGKGPLASCSRPLMGSASSCAAGGGGRSRGGGHIGRGPGRPSRAKTQT